MNKYGEKKEKFEWFLACSIRQAKIYCKLNKIPFNPNKIITKFQDVLGLYGIIVRAIGEWYKNDDLDKIIEYMNNHNIVLVTAIQQLD